MRREDTLLVKQSIVSIKREEIGVFGEERRRNDQMQSAEFSKVGMDTTWDCRLRQYDLKNDVDNTAIINPKSAWNVFLENIRFKRRYIAIIVVIVSIRRDT